MSSTSPSSNPRERRSLSPALKVVLFVVLPIIVVALIAFAIWGAFRLFGNTTPVNLGYSVAAGSSIDVTAPDASFDFRPGTGDQVKVKVTGTAFGTEPKFTVDTAADVTRIEGGCAGWLSYCSLHITVTLPASSKLSVDSTNSSIAVERLTGAVTIGTVNGLINVREVTGRLDLHTTNGVIRLRDASSDRVTAKTTNGSVELAFLEAPTDVVAQSTNGRIVVQVPTGSDYFVDAQTTNGKVTQEIASNRAAKHSISARTTNGSVTIEGTDQ